MLVCIERPDGTTYLQYIDDDFYSLLELKASIGPKYWITEIIDLKGE